MKRSVTILSALMTLFVAFGQKSESKTVLNSVTPLSLDANQLFNDKAFRPNISNTFSWDYKPDFYPDHQFNPTECSSNFFGEYSIASWQNGYITGRGARSTLPGLMTRESGMLQITQGAGNITFTAGVSADKYGSFHNLSTTYGLHSSITYRVNDNISFTAFGKIYSNSIYNSPATMPYIGQTSYGGYMSMRLSDRFGIDVGIERTYNPWSRSMETVPIIMPYYKFNKNFSVGIDVGYFIKDLFFDDNKYRNPTMSPPKASIPIAPRR